MTRHAYKILALQTIAARAVGVLWRVDYLHCADVNGQPHEAAQEFYLEAEARSFANAVEGKLSCKPRRDLVSVIANKLYQQQKIERRIKGLNAGLYSKAV